MKGPALKFAVILALAVPVLTLLQHFIPPLGGLGETRVVLLPSLVVLVGLAFDLIPALVFFAYAGFLWDAFSLPLAATAVEEVAPSAGGAPFGMPIGWSMLAFGALGLLAHGFRPLFVRGRWEVHCLLGGVCTAVSIAAEYLSVTVSRPVGVEHRIVFELSPEAFARILAGGAVALLVSPLLYLLFRLLASSVGLPLQRAQRRAL